MSPIRDANLVVRAAAAGSLAASGTATTVTEVDTLEIMYGTPLNGMALQVIVPQATSLTSLFVDIAASTSTNPTTDEIVGTSQKISAAGEYFIPFTVKPDTSPKILEVTFSAVGSDSNLDLGAVTAYVVENVGWPLAR